MLLPLLFLIIGKCGGKAEVRKLQVQPDRKFNKLKFEMVFERTLLWGKWCVPFSQGIICNQVMDTSYRRQRFLVYNFQGNLAQKKEYQGGQGPHELRATVLDWIWKIQDGKILVLDIRDYLKTINPQNFRVDTINRLDNLIKGYRGKFILASTGFGDPLAMKGDKGIALLESTGFYQDYTHYIAKFNGFFKDFKVVGKYTRNPPWTGKILRKKKISYIDFYWTLRLRGIYAVDWKREMVYYIPEIEKPNLYRISFDGKKRSKYFIPLNYKNFSVDKRLIEKFCEWNLEETPDFLKKKLRFRCYMPKNAPPLQDIKILGNWLLIITGKRNWKRGENWTLVYKLPELKFKGTLYLPFPGAFPGTKWWDGFYITRDIVEQEDEYKMKFVIYRLDFGVGP